MRAIAIARIDSNWRWSSGLATRSFLRRMLGPLAEPGEGAERLRATLAAYLACGQQGAATARRLGVHRNTISYRLRALETRSGRRCARVAWTSSSRWTSATASAP